MGRGRAPCCAKVGLNKGSWTPEEDMRLIAYIRKYGHANWRALPKLAGLLRCGKSCRLRWINYLSPDIKRGNFTNEEEDTIIRLHNSLGNKWSKIASHLPGRTDNEIKNVWHTHIKKKLTYKDKKVKELTIKETPSSSSSVTTNLVSNINSNEVSKHDNEDTSCKDTTINFNCVDSTDTYVEPSFDLTDLSFLEMNWDIFSPLVEQYYNSTENNVNSEMNLDEIPLMTSPCSSSFKGDVFEQETGNSIEGGGNGTDCSNLYNMDDHFEWNPRSFEELGECNKKEELLEELERKLGLGASSDQDNLEAVESCLWMEGDPVSNYFQDDSPAFYSF